MSAITKPHVNFTNSTNANRLYNVEDMINAESMDIPAPPNGPASDAESLIVITYRAGHIPQSEKVKFATSTLRNTSLTNLKTAISTAIA